MTSRIDPLLEPLTVRGLTLPNRIIMSPMTRGASPNGVPGGDVAAYYARRAAGGVGTIFTESVFVDDKGTMGKFGLEGGTDKPNPWPLMFGKAPLEGWRGVVDAVHAAGAVIFPQLMHLGVQRSPAKDESWGTIHISSPSGLFGTPEESAGLPPEAQAAFSGEDRAMTEAEILSVIAAFASAAAGAKSVGFDGIALHGGHGYLIDNFMRAETNRRTDRWGGDHLGRMRFPVELVRAVRAAIGDDMPISFRFSQWTHHNLDAQLFPTRRILEDILGALNEAGVDIFEASARAFTDTVFEGDDRNLAALTREIAGKPTVMIGGTGVYREKYESALVPPKVIDNVDEVMERFARGEFDLLAVGRSLLNDPDWVKKAMTGEPFAPFNPACLKLGYLE
ncbi:MAG TPA: 12-oxophytodienoate reductase [Novosphingobium sp.]|nr:12-oxophytodienoate reductase [Novosphingobium sp.]